MTSKDLKDLLQTMATEGTDRVEVDERELIPRIRSRRRRRAGLAAAVSASTAVVIAAAAFAVLPDGDQKQPPVAGPTTAAPVVPTVTITAGGVPRFACGSAFTAPVTGDPSLRLEVTQQVVTRDAGANTAGVGLQVTNTTGNPLELFGTPAAPGIIVVKDGIVVATRLAEQTSGHNWTFAPGQTDTLKSGMATTRCLPDGTQGSDRLEPGSYQIYATKEFTQQADAGRRRVTAAGGPWTIELK